jgi:hypothetical protein
MKPRAFPPCRDYAMLPTGRALWDPIVCPPRKVIMQAFAMFNAQEAHASGAGKVTTPCHCTRVPFGVVLEGL